MSTIRSREVLVTGQSLLDAKASALGGRVADYALPNYNDFPSLTRALDAVVRAHSTLWISSRPSHPKANRQD